MRARTPLTSAERQLLEAQRMREARYRGREPERLGQFAPLLIDGALRVGHPLSDSVEERRALQRRVREGGRGL